MSSTRAWRPSYSPSLHAQHPKVQIARLTELPPASFFPQSHGWIESCRAARGQTRRGGAACQQHEEHRSEHNRTPGIDAIGSEARDGVNGGSGE